jgi:hypothetical protein
MSAMRRLAHPAGREARRTPAPPDGHGDGLAPPALAYNTVCFAGAVVGPLATGWIKDLTGSFAAGLHAAAALSVVCAVTAMALSPASRAAPGPLLAARYRP